MQLGLPFEEAVHPPDPVVERSGCPVLAERVFQPAATGELWERVFSTANLRAALQRVERNRGAPGVDGVTVEELGPWLHDHWSEIRTLLDEGCYRPAPVRRVEIPKPGGGVRGLGVPTVLDRLIQQAIAQVLTPIFDPGFSDASFGFRPGRSAHQAVEAARQAIADGHRWVVDVDLEKFFDRVNHDKLMARVARKVDDKRVLKLIRAYVEAGVMVDGVKQATVEGTPQGSPLSPLLSNIMLDDLDKRLEERQHIFVRYADDLRVFLRSERAARRVLDRVTAFVENDLKLKVNQEKSTIATASTAGLLGFGFFFAAGPTVKIRVHPKARKRLKDRIRELTSRRWGVSMEFRLDRLNRFIAGWMAYFGIAHTPKVFAETDKWVRRRLRQIRWKEWKRYATKRRNLIALGVTPTQAREWAGSSKGYWRVAGSPILTKALPNNYWDDLGLKDFSHWHKARHT